MTLSFKQSKIAMMQDMLAVCDVDDFYFYGVNARCADLKRMFKVGDEVRNIKGFSVPPNSGKLQRFLGQIPGI